MTEFSMAGKSPNRTLSVFYANGDEATVPESHEQFSRLVDRLLHDAEDDEIRDLVNIMLSASKKLTNLSERVSLQGGTLLFDGDPINGILVDTILNLSAERSDKLGSVVNFLEKVKTNPDISTIDGLWKWITNGDLTIHEDGDFLAYKGTVGTGDERTSASSGKAFVNGEEHVGLIPNPDGATVTMPRSTVDDGGYAMCSTGLHVATHSFATGFARGRGDIVLVKINPRDVVSVPAEGYFEKLRVCRYTVLHAVDGRLDDSIYVQPELEDADVDEAEAPEAEALWNQSSLGDEEDVAGEPEQDEDELQDKLNEALGIDDSFYEDEEETPKLESLAEREPVCTDEPAEDKPVVDVSESIRKDLAAATESVQKALRDANGRFTKEGARHEAIAGKRDALGRFIKNS